MLKREQRLWLVVFALLLVGGCGQTSAPIRRDILGSWVGTGPEGIAIQMTIAETARSIAGAGAWMESGEADAFSVSGALAGNRVSLYFDFSAREDITFQGDFITADRIVGTLNGGGFFDAPVRFDRVP